MAFGRKNLRTACRHRAVIPNSLRGISPSFWPASDGQMHFDGLCDYCKQDVWRHARPDEDPAWRLFSDPCDCPQLQELDSRS
jgi:hypothetical protein